MIFCSVKNCFWCCNIQEGNKKSFSFRCVNSRLRIGSNKVCVDYKPKEVAK